MEQERIAEKIDNIRNQLELVRTQVALIQKDLDSLPEMDHRIQELENAQQNTLGFRKAFTLLGGIVMIMVAIAGFWYEYENKIFKTEKAQLVGAVAVQLQRQDNIIEKLTDKVAN